MSEKPESIHKELPPGGQTRWSTMLNGMGNGAMLAGGGLFVVRQGLSRFGDAAKDPNAGLFGMSGVIVTCVGGLIGAVHGLVEGKQIQNYRKAIAERIDVLESQAQSDQRKIEELYRQVQGRETAVSR